MTGFSNSAGNAIINNQLRGQVAPTIRTLYFALFTSDPTNAFTSGTEVSAAWYVRKATGAWSVPANKVTYNTTRVEFTPVSGSSVTVTHIGIVEGASATDATATLLYSHALSVDGSPTPKTLGINDVYVVDSATTSGDYTITLV
jgi:hypothetical protein